MQRFAWVLSVFLILALRLAAAPVCMSDTLANYEKLGATGCTIGPQTVTDFFFTVGLFGGGAVPLTDAQITVTPTFGAGGSFYGASFASGGFVVTGGGFVNYLIGYTWDSIPISGMGDVLDPGPVDILTNGCVGKAFVGPLCTGTPVSVDVFQGHNRDSVSFAPALVVGIRNNISMNAMGGTASFDKIENDTYIPEPASWLLAGLGVIFIAAGIRRRKFTATNG